MLAMRLMNRHCVVWTVPAFVACYNLVQVIGGVGHQNLLIVPCKLVKSHFATDHVKQAMKAQH